MQKIILIGFILCTLWLPAAAVHAQNTEPPPGSLGTGLPTPDQQKFVPLAGLPGFTDQSDLTLPALVQALYRLLIVIGAMVAVLKITIAGFKYMGSDNLGNKASAREDIKNALLGLLILLATVLILETVLGRGNFSLNWLQNAPQIQYRPNVAPIANPAQPQPPGTMRVDPDEGCFQAASGSCGSGNVSVFKGSNVGCEPANAIPTVPGQSTFKYMTQKQCAQAWQQQNGKATDGDIQAIIKDGRAVYGVYEIRKGADQPTTDSLLDACKAAGGTQVVKTKSSYGYNSLSEAFKAYYSYYCTS